MLIFYISHAHVQHTLYQSFDLKVSQTEHECLQAILLLESSEYQFFSILKLVKITKILIIY